MERRELLLGIALGAAGVAGCTTDDEAPDEYIIHEDGLLIEVTVEEGFNETVELTATCRSDSYILSAGDAVELTRNSDGETCDVEIRFEGEVQYDAHIEDYVGLYVTVEEDGNVDVDKLRV